MHTNHRRKNKAKNFRRRWRTRLVPYKQSYWSTERARSKDHLVHGRFDEFQDTHPRSILWEVL